MTMKPLTTDARRPIALLSEPAEIQQLRFTIAAIDTVVVVDDVERTVSGNSRTFDFFQDHAAGSTQVAQQIAHQRFAYGVAVRHVLNTEAIQFFHRRVGTEIGRASCRERVWVWGGGEAVGEACNERG